RKPPRPTDVVSKNEGDFLFRKAFQRQQQEGLARQRRDVGQPPLGRHRQRRHVGVFVDRNRIPDPREQAKQSGARTKLLIQQRRVLEQGLEHGRDVSVARRLASRQGTGIAPQQRQMFSN